MKPVKIFALFSVAYFAYSCNKAMPIIKLSSNKKVFKVGEAITWDASQSLNTTSFSWRVDSVQKLDSIRPQFVWTFKDTGLHTIAVTCVNKNKSGVTEEQTINVQP